MALTGVVIAVVVLILATNSSDATRDVHKGANQTTLTPRQSDGRRLFANTCAVCHTLASANAVGKVGPNLDMLRPSEALVETAIRVGFVVPQGVMPAGLLSGPDARAVADYVSSVTMPPAGARTATTPAPPAGATTTPPAASTGTGTAATPAAGATAGDATAGAAVFSQNCSVCHGPRGLGGGGGPNLTTMPLARTVAGVTQQVTNGGGGMPAFRGQLSDRQIADVAAFVTSAITRGR